MRKIIEEKINLSGVGGDNDGGGGGGNVHDSLAYALHEEEDSGGAVRDVIAGAGDVARAGPRDRGLSANVIQINKE